MSSSTQSTESMDSLLVELVQNLQTETGLCDWIKTMSTWPTSKRSELCALINQLWDQDYINGLTQGQYFLLTILNCIPKGQIAHQYLVSYLTENMLDIKIFTLFGLPVNCVYQFVEDFMVHQYEHGDNAPLWSIVQMSLTSWDDWAFRTLSDKLKKLMLDNPNTYSIELVKMTPIMMQQINTFRTNFGKVLKDEFQLDEEFVNTMDKHFVNRFRVSTNQEISNNLQLMGVIQTYIEVPSYKLWICRLYKLIYNLYTNQKVKAKFNETFAIYDYETDVCKSGQAHLRKVSRKASKPKYALKKQLLSLVYVKALQNPAFTKMITDGVVGAQNLITGNTNSNNIEKTLTKYVGYTTFEKLQTPEWKEFVSGSSPLAKMLYEGMEYILEPALKMRLQVIQTTVEYKVKILELINDEEKRHEIMESYQYVFSNFLRMISKDSDVSDEDLLEFSNHIGTFAVILMDVIGHYSKSIDFLPEIMARVYEVFLRFIDYLADKLKDDPKYSWLPDLESLESFYDDAKPMLFGGAIEGTVEGTAEGTVESAVVEEQ